MPPLRLELFGEVVSHDLHVVVAISKDVAHLRDVLDGLFLMTGQEELVGIRANAPRRSDDVARLKELLDHGDVEQRELGMDPLLLPRETRGPHKLLVATVGRSKQCHMVARLARATDILVAAISLRCLQVVDFCDLGERRDKVSLQTGDQLHAGFLRSLGCFNHAAQSSVVGDANTGLTKTSRPLKHV